MGCGHVFVHLLYIKLVQYFHPLTQPPFIGISFSNPYIYIYILFGYIPFSFSFHYIKLYTFVCMPLSHAISLLSLPNNIYQPTFQYFNHTIHTRILNSNFNSVIVLSYFSTFLPIWKRHPYLFRISSKWKCCNPHKLIIQVFSTCLVLVHMHPKKSIYIL